MFINDVLKSVRSHFVAEGFDIRFVGGCVRDHVLGIKPKDIDLCTDADPDQQIAIYKKHKIRFIPTGLDHGTITIVLNDECYEITSLRVESNHDGRHADVSYTSDWLEDARRRDLTFNAMSMTFDGDLIDPFGGKDDLENKRCRFVGVSKDRIHEDYLRILRWFRFWGRFKCVEPNNQTKREMAALASNLSKISRERIWQEMSKIVADPSCHRVLKLMVEMNIDRAIGTRFENIQPFCENPNVPPFVIMTKVVGRDHAEQLAIDWKLSSSERYAAKDGNEIAKEFLTSDKPVKAFVKEQLVRGKLRSGVESFCFYYKWPTQWATMDIPEFPLKGRDIQGIIPVGPEMGKTLTRLKEEWISRNYVPDKTELLSMI